MANKCFGVNNARPDNLNSKCKSCLSAARRKNREDNPETYKAQWKRNKYAQPENAENRRLRAAYGITTDIRKFISNKQSDRCAICGADIKLVVDHDHDTGIVRGLLCNKCNLGLGGFDDNIDRVKNAYYYLLDFNEKQLTEFN